MAGEAGRRKIKHRVPLKALCRVASLAAGIQFGYGLQLSLLTPYVQELGIPHQYASLIWLCGPISGLFVQPIVGHYSDICTSSFGRRRPFIIGGAGLVILAVIIVGFAADFGHLLGDPLSGSTPRAIVLFVIGFWILDLANNTLQGPCRALLADLTGKDQRRTRVANAFFSLFIGIGNVLGFLAGFYDKWAELPLLGFTRTGACTLDCSNLKSAFLVGSILLVVVTIVSVTAADEIPWKPESKNAVHAGPEASTPLIPEKPLPGASGQEVSKLEDPEDDDEDEVIQEAFIWELFSAFRTLPKTMWYVLICAGLTWMAWFPFLLFDTDWMGSEVYLGNAAAAEGTKSLRLYTNGVHMGSLGLMLNSVVLGITSLLIDWMCSKVGASRVWGITNGLLAICFCCTGLISWAAKMQATDPPSGPSLLIVALSLLLFAILGIPYAILYSVPYALTAIYTEKMGGGQGLSMGMLNIAICLSQLTISLLSGPFDSLFGGGNVPSFLLGAGSATAGLFVAFFLLPKPPPGFKARGLRRTLSSPVP